MKFNWIIGHVFYPINSTIFNWLVVSIVFHLHWVSSGFSEILPAFPEILKDSLKTTTEFWVEGHYGCRCHFLSAHLHIHVHGPIACGHSHTHVVEECCLILSFSFLSLFCFLKVTYPFLLVCREPPSNYSGIIRRYEFVIKSWCTISTFSLLFRTKPILSTFSNWFVS